MINRFRKNSLFFEGIGLTFLLFVSFLIRYFSSTWIPTYPDSFTYLKLSQYIQEGRYYLDVWARGEMIVKPLYSILTNIFATYSNNIEYGASWVSLISGILLIIPVFILAKLIAGRAVAWISAIIVAVNPELINYSTYILTESLATFIFLVILTACYWMMKEKMYGLSWILIGFITGLSLMSRDVAIITIPVIMLWLFYFIFNPEQSGRKMVFVLVLFLAGIVLFKGTSVLYYSSKDFKPRPTVEMIEKKILAPDLRDHQERERYLSSLTEDGKDYFYNQYRISGKSVAQLIWENKGVITKKLFVNVYGHVNVIWKSLPSILLIFFLIGIVINAWYGKDLFHKFFLISWFIIYILFYVSAGSYTVGYDAMSVKRYLLPVFLRMFIWSGMGIIFISQKIPELLQNRIQNQTLLKYSLSVFLTLLIIANYVPGIRESINIGVKLRKRVNHDKISGEVIKRKYPNTLIMTRLPMVPYYAGAKWLMVPDEPIARIVNFAKYKGVDLIFVDAGTVMTRPQLSILLHTDSSVDGLMPVFKVFDPKNKDVLRLAVYRIK